MTNRLNRLPENGLSDLLDNLEGALDSFKSGVPQPLQSSVVSFQSDTGAAYDWTGTLPQQVGGTTGQGMAVFSVSATAEHMANLYANLNDQLFIGGAPSPLSWYRPSNYLADIAASAFGFQTFYLDVPNNTGLPATRTVIVSLLGDLVRTAYLKFYVLGLDTATLTITRLI